MLIYGDQRMVTQQAFEPLVNQECLKQVVQTLFDPARMLKRAGSKIFEQLLSWIHKRQASYMWNQTVLTGKLVQQETSNIKVVQNIC